jgi:hypothetical protein
MKITGISIQPNGDRLIEDEVSTRLNGFEFIYDASSIQFESRQEKVRYFRKRIQESLGAISTTSMRLANSKSDSRRLRQEMVQTWIKASKPIQASILESVSDFSCAWDIERRELIGKNPEFETNEHWYFPHTNLKLPTASESRNFFITRTGIVEQRLIDLMIKDRASVIAASEEISRTSLDEAFMYRKSQTSHYMANDDASFAIRQLMTNAGMYFSDSNENLFELLEFWHSKYLNAQIETTSFCDRGDFSHTPFAYHAAEIERLSEGLELRFNPKLFLESLNGHRIVIATPYFEELNHLYSQSQQPNLYQNFKLPDFKLHAVQAEISTFPNKPGKDWRDTFDSLFERSVKAIKDFEATIFMASSGCYGLPLVSEVSKKTGIGCVYIGQVVNNLLGIKSGSILPKNLIPNHDVFQSSNLSKFKNFDLIDGGRYT